jgi:hypothetical protein
MALPLRPLRSMECCYQPPIFHLPNIVAADFENCGIICLKAVSCISLSSPTPIYEGHLNLRLEAITNTVNDSYPSKCRMAASKVNSAESAVTAGKVHRDIWDFGWQITESKQQAFLQETSSQSAPIAGYLFATPVKLSMNRVTNGP